MQKLVKHTLYLFLWITGITALVAITGLLCIWFMPDKTELPHLEWLLLTVVGEIVAVTILLAKKGLKYLPETQTDKNPEDTLKFMRNFISTGTSATIVSNRVSWLAGNQNLISTLKSKIDSGTQIEIITPVEVSQDLINSLSGASFIVTGESASPEARFTLVNGNRSGSEKLAIAKGVHPDHEITIFDNNSGPQIIAMAKDIIKKSKGQANAQ